MATVDDGCCVGVAAGWGVVVTLVAVVGTALAVEVGWLVATEVLVVATLVGEIVTAACVGGGGVAEGSDVTGLGGAGVTVLDGAAVTVVSGDGVVPVVPDGAAVTVVFGDGVVPVVPDGAAVTVVPGDAVVSVVPGDAVVSVVGGGGSGVSVGVGGGSGGAFVGSAGGITTGGGVGMAVFVGAGDGCSVGVAVGIWVGEAVDVAVGLGVFVALTCVGPAWIAAVGMIDGGLAEIFRNHRISSSKNRPPSTGPAIVQGTRVPPIPPPTAGIGRGFG